MEVNKNELLSKDNLIHVFRMWKVEEVPETINPIINKWIGCYSIGEIAEASSMCINRINRIEVHYINGVLQNKYNRKGRINNMVKGTSIPLDEQVTKIFIKYCKENNVNPVLKLEEFMSEYSKGAEILYTNKF